MERYEKLNAIGFPWWNAKGKGTDWFHYLHNNFGEVVALNTFLIWLLRVGRSRKIQVDEETHEAKKDQEISPETKEKRQRELEEFFGASLERYPGIIDKFGAKNSEQVIDNAIEWLARSAADTTNSDEQKIQSADEQDVPERRRKVALLHRIESVVGFGEDPLRELMDKGGFHVFSSDVSMRREDLEWLTDHYEEIKSTFLLSTFSKKVRVILSMPGWMVIHWQCYYQG